MHQQRRHYRRSEKFLVLHARIPTSLKVHNKLAARPMSGSILVPAVWGVWDDQRGGRKVERLF
jgi:hypothetical protein